MKPEVAPAKINLYLHVGPTRADGLHELGSLIVFAADGDALRVEPARALSLKVEGEFSPALAKLQARDNLVFKAARALQRAFGVSEGAAMRLDKRLPIASGVGGGSADAAAALRALTRLWNIEAGEDALTELGFELGADVPACLSGAPVIVEGAGERLSPGPSLPPLWGCLVNPRVETPTGPVFRTFDAAHSAPRLRPAPLLEAPNYDGVRNLLAATSNDLEPFAIERAPQIGAVLDFLGERPGALGARMSGSGATCFALFSAESAARRAAAAAAARGWWASASAILRTTESG